MLLRLHELPRQYGIGDDSGCGSFGGEEGTPEALERWNVTYRPRACEMEYERLFRLRGEDGPPIVSSLAVMTPSAQAAEEGFAIAPELLGYSTGDELSELSGGTTVGDATRAFHTDDALVFGKTSRPASVVFWRSRTSLAAIYVAGIPHAAGDRVALRLARVQQRHVEHPTPYTEAQQDWTTVPLEDPAIRFPIYWLGRTFRPGGLPATSLYAASAGVGGGLPGAKAELEYGDFSLRSWSRSSFRKYDADPILGPLVRDWRCTETTTLNLPGGQATIYGGYAKDFDACPQRPPDVFVAEARIGAMVIGAQFPICPACVEAARTPYNSLRGMEAIVRSLRIRRPRR